MGIPDARSTGRSRIVPYIEGESPMDRHNRRLGINLNNLPVVQGWCAENGFTLTIHNDGDHWTMEGHGGVVEWWPSSWKLVFNREWGRSICCLKYDELIRHLTRYSWAFKKDGDSK